MLLSSRITALKKAFLFLENIEYFPKEAVHVSLLWATITNKQKNVQIYWKFYSGLVRILWFFLLKKWQILEHFKIKIYLFSKKSFFSWHFVYYTPAKYRTLVTQTFQKHVHWNLLFFLCYVYISIYKPKAEKENKYEDVPYCCLGWRQPLHWVYSTHCTHCTHSTSTHCTHCTHCSNCTH